MYEYRCYTTLGSWTFNADDDHEAMRKALWFCWRDNEGFHYVERVSLGYKLSIARFDNNHSIETI